MKVRYNWGACIICVIFLTAIIVIAIIFITLGRKVLDGNTGYIGDTIGGTTAPTIGLISIFLLYKTLRDQQSFNEKQQKSIECQTQLIRDEQFKSTFFMLLQEQRDILKSLQTSCPTLDSTVVKIKTVKVSGQDFFSMAIYELKLIFRAMDMTSYQNGYDADDAGECMQQVYDQLYIGWGVPQELQDENKEMVNGAKDVFRQKFIFDKFKVTEDEYKRYKSMTIDNKIKYVYSKFFAHYENCGYYFRHLYRILKYIDTQKTEDLIIGKLTQEEADAKYNQFVQFLQSQMSQNEMLITYYNCFLFTKAKELMVKYKLLENLSKESLIREEHCCYAVNFGMKNRAMCR